MEEETEYEKQRQANIARNQALLRQLELADLGSSLAASSPKAKAKKPASSSTTTAKRSSRSSSRSSAVKRMKQEDLAPRRASARIRGLKPEGEGEGASAAAEEAYKLAAAKAEASRMRVPGTMKFEDMSASGLAQAWTFDDAVEEEDEEGKGERKELAKDVVQLRKEMSSLKLYERFTPNEIKITPERIFYMNFHPSVSHRLVLAGDKTGNLGVWDVDHVQQTSKSEDEDNEESISPTLYLFKVHARTLSSLGFAPGRAHKLYTASYDGSIRSVDFKSGTSSEIYFAEGNHDADGVCEMDFADSNTIYYSTFGGEIGRVDVRAPASEFERFRAHEKKVGGLSLHPGAPHICATSSLDRTMKIWDFRKITKTDDGERQASFVTEYGSRLSISCTSWNLAGDLVCNGYDDTINVFNLRQSATWKPAPSSVPELTPSSTIRHNCQSGKWVTILKAAWQANPADQVHKFVIGNMKRYMDVFNADGVQLARLGGEDVTTVPSACKFHPQKNWVVGGTASGKVVLFE